jgi:hypothetical protein
VSLFNGKYDVRPALAFLFMLCVPSFCFAQKEELKNSIIEQRIEEIAGTLDEGSELDYTNLFEDLTYFFEHPLNLNSASDEELRELYLITDLQITNLRRHMANYGKLRSIYELQAVEGFDPVLVKNLSYFVTVKPTLTLDGFSLSEFFRESNHDLFLRYRRNIQSQKGYLPDPETGEIPFAGTPDYMFTRYRLQYKKNFRAGFTLEKDAGESLQNGPDFYSFHAMYSGETWLRKLAVGDFQVLFGQGLTLWNGLAFGKSPFVTNVKRNPVGLRPYSSVQETNFLRGIGATIGVGNFEFTPFFSKKKLDASLDLVADTLVQDDEFLVSSLPLGGLHRTASEIEGKNRISETVYGGNVKYSGKNFSIGTTAVRTEFNYAKAPSDALYQLYRFSGDQNLNVGIDYQAVLRNANFFGEFSRSQNGGLAMLNGLVAALNPRLTLTMVQRWFGKDYQNLKANVFGENNLTAANEKGLFTGIQANLSSKFTLNGYVDLVQYPWARFRVDAPSVFSDYLIQLNYKPDRKSEFYLRYRIRNNVQNSSNPELLITYPVPVIQQNWRIHGTYQAHPNIQLKTRAEWSKFEKETNESSGFMVYQDLVFKKMGSKFTFTTRYALFDTDSWDTRIYAFESDVLYAFSILPYSGRGSRFYGMIKWDVVRGMDLWVRYGTFVYTDRTVISSGNTEIAGNQKSDVHIQLRLQF